MKRVLAIALWLLSVSLSAQVVTSAEFFWGTTDPGAGNGTAMSASDGSFDEAVEEVIKAGISLPSANGIHLFNIRVKDEDGNWGPLYKKAVSIENSLTLRDIKVTGAEFFWGTSDPGAGSGTALLAFDNAYDEALETVFKSGISLPSTNGIHLFNIRVKDEDGNWGPLYKKAVSIENSLALRDLKLTAVEYFWGTSDPGAGSGTAVLAFDNAYDEALETAFKAGVYPPLSGWNLFNIRAADEDGNWGPIYKRAVWADEGTNPIQIAFPTVLAINCNGGSDGEITATVTGGTAPYSLSWSNGDTVLTTDNLSAGKYVLTVTDATGLTNKDSVTLVEPTQMVVTTVSTTDVTCAGNDGAATVSVTGGTSPYTYSWIGSSSTTATANNLAAGQYTCTVSDANGCSELHTVTVSLDPASLSVTATSSDPSCFGGNDGSASLSVSGGQAPYSYSWSNGATSNSITGLSAGTFTVTITDVNSCQSSATVTLSNPTQIIAPMVSVTNPNCTGSNGTAQITNIISGASYYWFSVTNGVSTSAGTGTSLSGLSAGDYEVYGVTAAGCTTRTSSFVLVGSNSPISLALVTQTNVSCSGNSNGFLNVAASGGTAPYTYSWSNGGSGSAIINLSAGNYTVTVTDANGCTGSSTYTITQPSNPLAVNLVSAFDVNCYGASTGSITVNASGGQGTYSYAWSNGQTGQQILNLSAGTYTVTVTDGSGCSVQLTQAITEPTSGITATLRTKNDATCGGQNGAVAVDITGGTSPYIYSWSRGGNTDSIGGLGAGTYSLTVLDASGCSNTFSYTIQSTSSNLAVNASHTDVSCFGGTNGTGSLSVSGGTAPYSYSWSSSVTGFTSVNASNISSLQAGSYTVLVTDAGGCTGTGSFTVSEPSSALAVSSTQVVDVTCFGGNNGSITVAASGGTGPYIYSWNTGQSGSQLTNLVAGSYTVTVTDANGCTDSQTFMLDEPLTAPSVTLTAVDVACFGGSDGSITATVTGGTSPYTYSWNTGQSSSQLTNLVAGSYTLIVSDANGCNASAQASVLAPAQQLTLTSGASTDVLCYGDSTGALSVTAVGGTAPYSYAWTGPNGFSGSTASIANLTAGAYSVTVTDANNCMQSLALSVTQPTSPISATSSTVSNIVCFGGQGSITLIPTGGVAPYSFGWNSQPTNTTSSLTSSSAGYQVFTITDANGCTLTDSLAIQDNSSPISIDLAIKDVDCFGGNNGSMAALPVGGTAPYTFLWSTTSTQDSIYNLLPGSYWINVVDANGCSKTDTGTVGQPSNPITVVSNTTDVACYGDSSGSVNLTVQYFNSTYAIQWSTGDTTSSLTGLAAGIYSYVIQDSLGCSLSDSVMINQSSSPLNALLNGANPDCIDGSNGSITSSVAGGTPNYSYLWSTGDTTSTISALDTGVYALTVTDHLGCSVTDSVVLDVQNPIAVSILNQTPQLDCNADSTGVLTTLPSGGHGNYQFTWSNGQTSSSATGLPQGVYWVSVQDSKGCMSSDTTTISAPPPVATSIGMDTTLSGYGLLCYGDTLGQAYVSVLGGNGGYSFLWSNGSISDSVSSLSAGTYSVTITDSKGCSTTDSVTITSPASIQVNAGIITNSYGFTNDCWNSADGFAFVQLPLGLSAIWSNFMAGDTVANLTPGKQWVTLTDTLGCQSTDTLTMTAPAEVTTAVSVLSNYNGYQISCYGLSDGEASVSVSGGVGGYTWNWSNGGTTPINQNLSSGVTTVTISDALGCTTLDSVTMTEPNALSTSANVSDLSCYTSEDGAAYVNIAGGVTPYSVNWSGIGQSGLSATGLTAGYYSYVVTDGNGCSLVDSAFVDAPDEILLSIDTISPSCYESSDGELTFYATGGSGGFNYFLNNASSLGVVEQVGAQTFLLQAIDANNCSVDSTISLVPQRDECLVIPNYFSPNADGYNDTWEILGMDLSDYEVIVFNVAGQEIYRTSSANYEPWDGKYDSKVLPDGDYYFIIQDQTTNTAGYVTLRK